MSVNRFSCWCTCRECGHRQVESPRTLNRPNRARCTACGGMLDTSERAANKYAHAQSVKKMSDEQIKEQQDHTRLVS